MKVVVNVDCKYDGYAKYFASLLKEELARTYPDLSLKLEKFLDASEMSYNAFKEFFGNNPMKLLSNHLESVYRVNEDVRIVFNSVNSSLLFGDNPYVKDFKDIIRELAKTRITINVVLLDKGSIKRATSTEYTAFKKLSTFYQTSCRIDKQRNGIRLTILVDESIMVAQKVDLNFHLNTIARIIASARSHYGRFHYRPSTMHTRLNIKLREQFYDKANTNLIRIYLNSGTIERVGKRGDKI